jgi:hypothetical protein
MARFEAARIEHRVIEAPPAVVSEAVLHADFMDSLRSSRVVSGMLPPGQLASTSSRCWARGCGEATEGHVDVPRRSGAAR